MDIDPIFSWVSYEDGLVLSVVYINALGRANTQDRPYENDMTGRVKLLGADLCVCPDCRRLSDDTHKNKPDKYVIMH